eukprot:TRINITY_DN45014_c0_g4_i1.p1 TRINITY_DN45014_c0_g4~~TRINITY_DN45014_c0_g4_i1.p1  ORF type:complete len:517 (+),score=91.66 TRINITY_DN45014_c0_g4_i1:76-1626(+)
MAQTFTKDDVAKHCTADDLWIIVDGDVYDVTKFAKLHPGGRQALLDVAGRDATEHFYALHRAEVLEKYARLRKGRLGDAAEAGKGATDLFASVSEVPFAEPSYMQGYHSPYFKESHAKLRQTLRQFFAKEARAEALECEETGKAPSAELRRKIGDFGVIAMMQGPGEHLKLAPNGLAGGAVSPDEFDYFHELVVQEERSRTFCPGFEDGLYTGPGISIPVILKYGEKWMKELTLPAIFRGEQTSCLAITDPYAGSDVAGMMTRAELDADGEHYVIKGTKKWITGGMYADWFVTAARTGGSGAGGITMFLVPRTEAVQTKLLKTKYSSAAGTSLVSYEGARVPKKYMFGTQNKGFPMIMSNFNHERWMISAFSMVWARLTVEESFKWAMHRKAFGKKLVEQQVIREKLAEMFGALETCTSLLHETTHNMNIMGPESAQMGGRIALLKHQTTRMMHLVGDHSVQIFGGRAVTQGGMGRVIETFHRCYKAPSIYGGSEEIMADLAVKQAIKAYPALARL